MRSPFSRAKLTAPITSAVPVARTTSAGFPGCIALYGGRTSAYPGSPGVSTSPLIVIRSSSRLSSLIFASEPFIVATVDVMSLAPSPVGR